MPLVQPCNSICHGLRPVKPGDDSWRNAGIGNQRSWGDVSFSIHSCVDEGSPVVGLRGLSANLKLCMAECNGCVLSGAERGMQRLHEESGRLVAHAPHAADDAFS